MRTCSDVGRLRWRVRFTGRPERFHGHLFCQWQQLNLQLVIQRYVQCHVQRYVQCHVWLYVQHCFQLVVRFIVQQLEFQRIVQLKQF